jgi:hypothetical protein
MRWPSRLMVCLVTLVVLCLDVGLMSTAIAWTLRFAPLDHTTSTATPFAPSTSVPVTPHFLRILVIRNQIIFGIEAPYMQVIKLKPPIDFQQLSDSTTSSVPSAVTPPTFRSRHDLRGPEGLLLRHPQTLVGHTLP